MRRFLPALCAALSVLSFHCSVSAASAAPERLLFAGDYPDPSVVRDGDTYYMVHSSFEYVPGLRVYKSDNLVDWEPVADALTKYVGSVYAPDIVKHDGKWYIYFPAVTPAHGTNMVVRADSPEGPWSEPIDLRLGGIDPGHVADAEGNRYLMMSAGQIVPLSPDGLSVVGPVKKIYDGWEYPAEWDVEGFCLEGPKVAKVGKYYYMLSAEGGTAGPPTSHMVVVARAESLLGPWENSPYNPLIRTADPDERWCSKGHGTLVDTPDGRWYVVYHAYERGYYTLGRQTLAEPVEMTADGWFVASPKKRFALPEKKMQVGLSGFSGNFSESRLGRPWQFVGDCDPQRVRFGHGSFTMQAQGATPSDCSPMLFATGDHAYEMQVEAECPEGADAGLVLYYNPRLYTGVGLQADQVAVHVLGRAELFGAKPGTRRVWFRLRNDRHTVSFWYSVDGRDWIKMQKSCEVSGYHHNMAGEFLSLRPGIYAAGRGEVVFRDFSYRTLPASSGK